MDITGINATARTTSYVSPVAGELTKTLKTGVGYLQYLRACNTTATAIYVFVFDNTTASGTLLTAPIPVPANGHFELNAYGIRFATGCTLSASTSQTTYTAAGANSLQVHALFG